MLKASVVIPNHNRPEKLRETLARLSRQQPDTPPFEVIVVDDGSQPPVQAEPSAGPNLHVLRLESQGRSAARNRGAEAAAGEVLIFIDDDILVAPDFVKRHWRMHGAGASQYVVGAIQLPASALQTPFGRFRQALEQHALPIGAPVPPNFCAAGNMSIRRTDFLRVGGFDPSIASGEDQDLALRAASLGIRGVYEPGIAAIHSDSALDFRSYCRRMEWGYRQIHPFLQRHPAFQDNQARGSVNGPARLGREPLRRSMKKLLKSVLVRRPCRTALEISTAAIENLWPGSALLPRLYRGLLGLYIFRGYRAGLRQYGSTTRAGLHS